MSAMNIITRALSAITGPTAKSGSVIHLALSGGVDSSVSAFLLRERGWDVRPVIMRCWASEEEDIGLSCFEKEVRASEKTVRALNLRQNLAVFDFVSEYWSQVFDGVLLAGLAKGLTPNQDLACNRNIKFGAFPERLAKEMGSATPPYFATGHYAQVQNDDSRQIKLLRAVDDAKDQTYFLASVEAGAFANVVFPVGSLLKTDVRLIAAHVGLPAVNEKSSRGICFVGKRKMSHFVSSYLSPPSRDQFDLKPQSSSHVGNDQILHQPSFVLDGQRIGPLLQSKHSYTVGQRARLGGAVGRLYVAEKNGTEVALLRRPPTTRHIVCAAPHWISSDWYNCLDQGKSRLLYKGNSSACLAPCHAHILPDGGLEVRFVVERPAIAPGQVLVLYNGPEVLGSAVVERSIITGLKKSRSEPHGLVGE